jgi:predicted DNA-binding transcriptional regulator YafY
MTRTELRSPATLPPLTLTPDQAAAIAAALAAHPGGPYAGHGLAALQKVLGVLEPDEQRRTELLATSLWVSAQAAESAAVRATVERAVVQRRVLVLRYRDGKGRPSRREVEPQLLARGPEHWFLVAWCRERQAPRWFRLDRIASAEASEEVAPRRDPGLFGAPSDTHPAGRGLRPKAPEPQAAPRGAPRLTVLPGGRA